MTGKDVDRLLGAYYARRLEKGDGLYGKDDGLARRVGRGERLKPVDCIRADAARADAARADAARADAAHADAARADGRLSAVLAAAALVMMLGFGVLGSPSGDESGARNGLVASMSLDLAGSRFEEAVIAIGDSWPRKN
ncbi:MAG TPA: hypothetical protein PLQ29_05395 [Spirochaetales bacterium]|nr:hypothetical protein [Spirochaetales bacterium]